MDEIHGSLNLCDFISQSIKITVLLYPYLYPYIYVKGTNNPFKVEKSMSIFRHMTSGKIFASFLTLQFQENVITVYYSMDTTN